MFSSTHDFAVNSRRLSHTLSHSQRANEMTNSENDSSRDVRIGEIGRGWHRIADLCNCGATPIDTKSRPKENANRSVSNEAIFSPSHIADRGDKIRDEGEYEEEI